MAAVYVEVPNDPLGRVLQIEARPFVDPPMFSPDEHQWCNAPYGPRVLLGGRVRNARKYVCRLALGHDGAHQTPHTRSLYVGPPLSDLEALADWLDT